MVFKVNREIGSTVRNTMLFAVTFIGGAVFMIFAALSIIFYNLPNTSAWDDQYPLFNYYSLPSSPSHHTFFTVSVAGRHCIRTRKTILGSLYTPRTIVSFSDFGGIMSSFPQRAVDHLFSFLSSWALTVCYAMLKTKKRPDLCEWSC